MSHDVLIYLNTVTWILRQNVVVFHFLQVVFNPHNVAKNRFGKNVYWGKSFSEKCPFGKMQIGKNDVPLRRFPNLENHPYQSTGLPKNMYICLMKKMWKKRYHYYSNQLFYQQATIKLINFIHSSYERSLSRQRVRVREAVQHFELRAASQHRPQLRQAFNKRTAQETLKNFRSDNAPSDVRGFVVCFVDASISAVELQR